MHFSNCNK